MTAGVVTPDDRDLRLARIAEIVDQARAGNDTMRFSAEIDAIYALANGEPENYQPPEIGGAITIEPPGFGAAGAFAVVAIDQAGDELPVYVLQDVGGNNVARLGPVNAILIHAQWYTLIQTDPQRASDYLAGVLQGMVNVQVKVVDGDKLVDGGGWVSP